MFFFLYAFYIVVVFNVFIYYCFSVRSEVFIYYCFSERSEVFIYYCFSERSEVFLLFFLAVIQFFHRFLASEAKLRLAAMFQLKLKFILGSKEPISKKLVARFVKEFFRTALHILLSVRKH